MTRGLEGKLLFIDEAVADDAVWPMTGPWRFTSAVVPGVGFIWLEAPAEQPEGRTPWYAEYGNL